MGHDFGAVRVHTDADAAASAREIGAHAYTAGKHIAFAPGRYAPGSKAGNRLIAHELVHVIQQGGGDRIPLTVGAASDPAEREAEAIAEDTATSIGGPSVHPVATWSIVTGEGEEGSTRTAGPVATQGPTSPAPQGGCNSVSGTAVLPSGTLPATLTGTELSADWFMSADFTSNPADPAICGPCGEYRQEVRGTFTKNGATVTHPLCGTNLDPNSFQEDCGVIGGKQYKYGYHAIPFPTSRFTKPDQARGQRWDGYDGPGIIGASGDTLGIDLEFMGSIVDVCNWATLGGSSWKVQGAATVP